MLSTSPEHRALGCRKQQFHFPPTTPTTSLPFMHDALQFLLSTGNKMETSSAMQMYSRGVRRWSTQLTDGYGRIAYLTNPSRNVCASLVETLFHSAWFSDPNTSQWWWWWWRRRGRWWPVGGNHLLWEQSDVCCSLLFAIHLTLTNTMIPFVSLCFFSSLSFGACVISRTGMLFGARTNSWVTNTITTTNHHRHRKFSELWEALPARIIYIYLKLKRRKNDALVPIINNDRLSSNDDNSMTLKPRNMLKSKAKWASGKANNHGRLDTVYFFCNRLN